MSATITLRRHLGKIGVHCKPRGASATAIHVDGITWYAHDRYDGTLMLSLVGTLSPADVIKAIVGPHATMTSTCDDDGGGQIEVRLMRQDRGQALPVLPVVRCQIHQQGGQMKGITRDDLLKVWKWKPEDVKDRDFAILRQDGTVYDVYKDKYTAFRVLDDLVKRYGEGQFEVAEVF